MVHERYRFRGGEDVATETEVELLRAAGHEVTVAIEDNRRIAELGLFRTGLRTVWSVEGTRRIAELLAADDYDVVHVQNFFPLWSPAIHRTANRAGVPTVQTLHNYRLVCPAATTFRDGRPCRSCVGRRVPWPGVVHGCYRDSATKTAGVAAMVVGHRLLGTWRDHVGIYSTPSRFLARMYVEAGWSEDRIVVKPNAVFPDPGPRPSEGEYALFVGRLAEEKGLRLLLDAWRRDPPVPLRIVGDGPLRREVEDTAAASSGVSWLGHVSADEVLALMGSAAVVVVPSVWDEPFGRVVVEAFAVATPVVVSDRGALPELVGDGAGAVFDPDEPGGLVAAIDDVLARGAEAGAAARRRFEDRYSPEVVLAALEATYERAGRDR